MSEEECKHLNVIVSDHNKMYCGSCQDCGREIKLANVFHNWLHEFRGLLKEIRDALPS